jgi:hypothetical protein
MPVGLPEPSPCTNAVFWRTPSRSPNSTARNPCRSNWESATSSSDTMIFAVLLYAPSDTFANVSSDGVYPIDSAVHDAVPCTVFAGRLSVSPLSVRISLHSEATAPMSRRDRMISFAIARRHEEPAGGRGALAERAVLLDVEVATVGVAHVVPERVPELGGVLPGHAVALLLVLAVRRGRVAVVAEALLDRRVDGLLDLAVLHEELRRAVLALLELLELDRHLLELLVLLGGEVAVLLLGVLVELVHGREDLLALLAETPDVVTPHGVAPSGSSI